MQIELMLLLLLLVLRIMEIKHFYDFSFKKDYSIIYEKGKETRSRIFSYIEVLCVVTNPTSKFPSSSPPPPPPPAPKPLILIYRNWSILNSPNFATNDWFPCEMTYERRRQKFHTNDPSLPRSGSTWLVESNFPNDTFRSATQIWLVMRHQYSISALVSQTSFRGEGYYSASPNWAPGSRSLLLCMCCTTLIFTSTSLQKTPRTHSDT